MSDREAILFANTAFYAAFAGRDFAAMDDLWAHGVVTCIHPGWPPMRGRDTVMQTWRNILGNAKGPEVSAYNAEVMLQGATAVVTCIELLPGDGRTDTLAATNIFVKQGSIWKIVHHQAGVANVDPRTLSDEERPPMN